MSIPGLPPWTAKILNQSILKKSLCKYSDLGKESFTWRTQKRDTMEYVRKYIIQSNVVIHSQNMQSNQKNCLWATVESFWYERNVSSTWRNSFSISYRMNMLALNSLIFLHVQDIYLAMITQGSFWCIWKPGFTLLFFQNCEKVALL